MQKQKQRTHDARVHIEALPEEGAHGMAIACVLFLFWLTES